MSPADLLRSVEEYLALRRALGFKLRHETWFLPNFVAFLAEHGSTVITTELAVRWAQLPTGTTLGWWAHRLSSVRSFAKHRRAFDPRTEVPPPDIITYRAHRRTPHLYTTPEIATLLQLASNLSGPMRSTAYSALIGLLASTGMRAGEALGLDDDDIDWRRSLLTIRHAKFLKARLVPVHPSTLAALRAYVAQRDHLLPRRRGPALFVSGVGARIHHQNFNRVFIRLVRLSAIGCPAGRPRIHDLRHTFAMRTLRDWYRSGLDVERRLPVLSTYLGHVSPSSTYWYLTATPELLALAAKRLDRVWKERS